MKRIILIAAIIFAAASVAQAQLPKGTVSRESKANVNVESCKLEINKDKGVTSKSMTSSSIIMTKTDNQITLPKQNNPVRVTRNENMHESWKQHTPNAVYQRNFQSYATSYYSDACEAMSRALEKKVKAQKALLELTEKQKLEKAKLIALFEEAAPQGWENERWMVEDLQMLEKHHAKELAKATEKLHKAERKYAEAVKKAQDAPMEIYRMAMVRFR